MSSNGDYIFAPVKIGTYSLAAEFKGFKRVEQPHVSVEVQQRVAVNFVLPPGEMTQTVTVSTEVPLLQTEDASVGQVINAKAINDLPLNGRNFTFLAQLSAGVTQDQQDSRGLGASGSFAANGLGRAKQLPVGRNRQQRELGGFLKWNGLCGAAARRRHPGIQGTDQ